MKDEKARNELADWFAAMCNHDSTESHECNTLIAAHDVARMIRDGRQVVETNLCNERAEREDDEFREENLVPSLAAWRDAKVPQPEDGPPWMTIEWDGRVIFRDREALDEYVREAKEADRGR